MQSAVTLSLVPQARGGPFVFWDDLPQAARLAAELGFDAIELFPSSAEDVNASALRELLQETGLRIAAIGTGAGWVVRQLRLTDPDAHIRRQALDFVNAIVDLAGSFNAPAIIGSMQGRHEGSVPREQALSWLGEALEQLGPRAHAQGVPILYEPLNRYETNLFHRVEDAVVFINGLRTRNVRLLCDLFHMNIEEQDIAAALRTAGPLLGHVHFADSNRRAIGFGHTPMAPIMEALRSLGYGGYLSAEVLPWPDSARAAAQTIQAFRACTTA